MSELLSLPEPPAAEQGPHPTLSAQQKWPQLLVWALVGATWIGLFYLISTRVHGFGPATFAEMAAVVGLLAAIPVLNRRLRVASDSRIFIAIAAVVLLALGGRLAAGAADLTLKPENIWTGTDIAWNTFFAQEAFAYGKNPYVKKCQIGHEVDDLPHVTKEGEGRFKLYGVPYSNGYPYFPAMFLSYMPIHRGSDGLHSIRYGNAIILVLLLGGVLWLTRRLVPGPRGWAAALLAGVAFLGIPDVFVQEFFLLDVTDGVIALYAIAGFLLWSYELPIAAGVLFGFAQGCKLLPGPLLIIPLLIGSFGSRAFRQLLVGYVATSLVIVVPFVLMSPAHFFSSTILFYLVVHSGGDDTSLWYTLPSVIRPIFSLVGILATLGVLASSFRRRGSDLLAPMTASFAAFLVLTAFAPQVHLNYVWSIYPLGCIALAALLGRGAATSPEHGGGAAPVMPAA